MVRRGKEDGSMPATGAGLMRYFDEETRGPKMDPKVIIGFSIGVIVVEVLLHAGVLT